MYFPKEMILRMNILKDFFFTFLSPPAANITSAWAGPAPALPRAGASERSWWKALCKKIFVCRKIFFRKRMSFARDFV